MNGVIGFLQRDLLSPHTPEGAVVWGLLFVLLSAVAAMAIRRAARRLEPRLNDVTGLRFLSTFGQGGAYLVGLILYAHLVPELRTLGTALLAGAGVLSVVVGIAAQNTLGNVAAGISLVVYRPIRVGDRVQVSTPAGLRTAVVDHISLGHTLLRQSATESIVVPNSVMMGSVILRLAAKTGDAESASWAPTDRRR